MITIFEIETTFSLNLNGYLQKTPSQSVQGKWLQNLASVKFCQFLVSIFSFAVYKFVQNNGHFIKPTARDKKQGIS